jgi:fatty acid-binding protein DegV
VRTKKKAYDRLLEIASERLGGKTMLEATIADIDNPEDGDRVAEMVVECFNPIRIHRAEVSPVVGTHTGPGTIGLSFYSE